MTWWEWYLAGIGTGIFGGFIAGWLYMVGQWGKAWGKALGWE